MAISERETYPKSTPKKEAQLQIPFEILVNICNYTGYNLKINYVRR